jgi:hypothetical protein
MMDGKRDDFSPEIEERWREWSRTEPAIDEDQLRRNILARIPERRRQPRVRLVLLAAAASLLAVFLGIESNRHTGAPQPAQSTAIVHETDRGVILILREGKEPIYVLTGSSENHEGGDR